MSSRKRRGNFKWDAGAPAREGDFSKTTVSSSNGDDVQDEDYDDNDEDYDQRASEQPAAGEGRARHRGLDVHRQQGRR